MQNRAHFVRASRIQVAIVLLLAGSALGQSAPLGGGRALDRNLNASEGPINPSGPRIEDQIRYNNAIIYGYATDGKSFRGQINSRSPTAFYAPTGSNDLFNFQRDAAFSGVSGLGIRASDALRYQFALATGSALPSGGQGLGIAQPYTDVTTSSSALTASPGAARSTSEYLTGQSIRPALVGYQVDDQGYGMTAKASPLMGIEWSRSTAPVVRLDQPETSEDLGKAPNPLIPPPADYSGGDKSRLDTLGGADAAKSVVSKADRNPLNVGQLGSTERDRLTPPDLRVQAAQLDASSQYAQVLGAFKQGFETTKEPAPLTEKEKADQIQKAAADSSLDAQLARLRGHLRTDRDNGQTPGWNPAKPGKTADVDPTKPNLGDLLDKGKDQNTGVSKPESGQSDLAKLLNPGDNSIPDKALAQDNSIKLSQNERLTPEISTALQKTGSVRLERLAKVEAYDQPDRPDQAKYLASMTSGEAAFAEGRYFDAEEKFGRAMAAVPGDPMARIGRAHSQLGAGLFLSAAANLRKIFADHPELIAPKYAANLSIPADRADLLASQLREEITRSSSALGRDSAFLLAYLGHLRDDDKLVQEGLTQMGRRFDPTSDADATLYQLCKAAWVK